MCGPRFPVREAKRTLNANNAAFTYCDWLDFQTKARTNEAVRASFAFLLFSKKRLVFWPCWLARRCVNGERMDMRESTWQESKARYLQVAIIPSSFILLLFFRSYYWNLSNFLTFSSQQPGLIIPQQIYADQGFCVTFSNMQYHTARVSNHPESFISMAL